MGVFFLVFIGGGIILLEEKIYAAGVITPIEGGTGAEGVDRDFGDGIIDIPTGGLVIADEFINIPDLNLRAIINEELGHDPKLPVLKRELESLTSLDIDYDGAINLTGIEYCINLEWIAFYDCTIDPNQLSLISGLPAVDYLIIHDTNITDFSFLLNYADTLVYFSYSNGRNLNTNVGSILPHLPLLKEVNISGCVTDWSFVSKLHAGCEINDSQEKLFMFDLEWIVSDSNRNYYIPNMVKDHNGNPVAPKESYYYEYIPATNEIKITGLSNFDLDYEFDIVNPSGGVQKVKCYINVVQNNNAVSVLNGAQVAVGQSVVLTPDTSAFGANEIISYQWYKADERIPGATGSTFTINNAQESDSEKYYVVMCSRSKIVCSQRPVVLVGGAKPLAVEFFVNGSKNSQIAYVGQYIQSNCIPTGGTYEYDYYYACKYPDCTLLLGSNSKTHKYVFNEKGQYKLFVRVEDDAGSSVDSNAIIVNVYYRLAATFSVNGIPENKIVYEGDALKFIANATGGSEKYTYTYKVYNKDTGIWYTLAQNSSSTLNWTTDKRGNYTLYIEVKDTLGNVISSQGYDVGIYRKPGLYKESDGKWYYFVNDKVDTTFTGLAKNEYGWWYVKNGQLDRSYTGLVEKSTGVWVYVNKGQYDNKYTGLANNKYGTWYVKNGSLDRSYTGMYDNGNGNWVYINKGKFDTKYTGLANNKYGTWYIKNGKLDRTYTGLVEKSTGVWVYVNKGKYDNTYTGLANNQYGTWYVKKGSLDRSYTGMYDKGNGNWIYINKGKFDTTYTGMAKNTYGWFYMKNGVLDRTYTGLAKNQYGTWYMQKGKLNKNFSGKVIIGGKTYTIKNGKVV